MKAFANLSNEDIEKVYKTISSNVRRIRKEKGLTQTDVALSMGFTTATFFTNAENFNKKHFNLEHIIRIANILEIDICELFK
ncbi:helix-turn-helix domain-containing protein [Aliarcobacter lanthieri]|uniref:helix-turn-helix domain-containing protein n=1 Tax=Aliarcobacter lanthieri TaxID=1355374 RepID=UPI003AA9DBCF